MIELTRPERRALNRLSMQWLVLAFLNTLFLFSVYAMLGIAGQPILAIRWLTLSAIASSIFLWKVCRWLPLNRRDDHRAEVGVLMESLGAGNFVTIGRGMLLAGLAGFLFSPRPSPGFLSWIPGILYSLACCADLLDGYLARRAGQPTHLGERLDLFLDGFGVLFATVLLVQYGLAPQWFLLVGFARYLFLAGDWLWRRRGKAVYALLPSRVRRPLAGFVMGYTAVALLPVFSPPATVVAAYLFGIPFLANFALDWLTVSGVISSGEYKSQRQSLEI